MSPIPSQSSQVAVVDRAVPEPRTRSRTATLFSGQRQRSGALGHALTWLCGGALALNLLLVIAIMVLLAYNGLSYFWQKDLTLLSLKDGTKVLGEVWEVEQTAASTEGQPEAAAIDRFRIKVGNRDVGGLDFAWIDEKDVARRSLPKDVVMLERLEWGNFYGTMAELRAGGRVLASGPAAVWKAFFPLHEKKMAELERIEDLEKGAIGDVNYEIEQLRLDRRKVEIQELPAAEKQRRTAEIERELAKREAVYQQLADRLSGMRERFQAETLLMRTVNGETQEMAVGAVVYAIRPNDMSGLDKLGLYFSRIWEFVSADPRESNTEGGIFPAIFGTVMMVFLMSFAVAPLGVLAALYLREYAKQGPLVRMVRIAVNNLAGVPSIVFGMFGLGFFVYLVGGSIDQLFYPEALPSPTFGTGGILWGALTLALLTVPVVIVAAEEGLAAV
ncbi:MAG TPA: phosphate ABC transporter, permease protein PstA, partial [Thermoanaerobaculia bacterium]